MHAKFEILFGLEGRLLSKGLLTYAIANPLSDELQSVAGKTTKFHSCALI